MGGGTPPELHQRYPNAAERKTDNRMCTNQCLLSEHLS